ncbi:MAG: choice-of-anchor D domain-containing protein, partial [Deltaproteobacteria bacterium]|nr:choice-of-anchor D domain-containing protein [Deltaproteobacteria bacterium]
MGDRRTGCWALGVVLVGLVVGPGRAAANGDQVLDESLRLTGRGLGLAAAAVGTAQRGTAPGSATAVLALTDVPAGARVERALLYWGIAGSPASPSVTWEGRVVDGIRIGVGTDTCWGYPASTAFRADVTTDVAGNGVYAVAGLPASHGAPQPDSNGVSLWVIYGVAGSPELVTIVVRDGVLAGDTGLSTTFTGLPVGVTPKWARLRLLVGDGQPTADGATLFAGHSLGTDLLGGGAGSFWDDLGFDVGGLMAGAPSASVTLNHGAGLDCLQWIAAALVWAQPASPVLEVTPAAIDFGSVPVGAATGYATVTARNAGGLPLTLQGVSLSGAGDFTAPASGLPQVLAAGEEREIVVGFAAQAAGQRTATLTVASDAPQQPSRAVGLTGRGTVPQARLAPDLLDFGDVAVADIAPTLRATVHNDGEAPLAVTGASLGGGEAGDFLAPTATLPATVAPGASLALDMGFRPRSAGTRAATLLVATGDPSHPSLTVAVRGRGVTRALAGPATIDFGVVRVGTSVSRGVLVRSTGDGAVMLVGAGVAGAAAGSFTAGDPALPVILAAGQSVELAVAFAPDAVGDRTAVLVIENDAGPPLAVTLRGSGAAPQLEVDPGALEFGSHAPGVAVSRTVTIRNAGTALLRVATVRLEGPGQPAFAVGSGPADALLPAGTATVEVRFTAAAVGTELATLVVTADDPLVPEARVSLSGAGMAPELAIDPAALDFGEVEVGGAPAWRTVTITNRSVDNVSVTAIAAEGSASFQPGADLPWTLPPGGSMTATVAFAPTAAGTAAARIALSLEGLGATTLAVPASGQGITLRVHGGGCRVGGPGGPHLGLWLLLALAGLPRLRRWRGLVVPFALLVAVPARADSIDLSVVRPAAADPIAGASAPLGHLELAFGGTMAFARNPLVLTVQGDAATRIGLVRSRLTAEAGVALGLFGRVELGLRLPAVVYQDGAAGATFAAPAAAALGDLALAAKVRLWRRPTSLAIGLVTTVPTGDAAAYAGYGRVTLEPRLMWEWRGEAGLLAAAAGYRYRAGTPAAGGLPVGDELTASLIVGVRLGRNQLLAVEVVGATPVRSFGARDLTPLEALASLHLTFGRGSAGAAVGGGVVSGYGASDFRVATGGAWRVG